MDIRRAIAPCIDVGFDSLTEGAQALGHAYLAAYDGSRSLAFALFGESKDEVEIL